MLPVVDPYDARVRRLIILVCALITCDLMLWSAVVPLVPHYRHELGLSTIQVAWMLASSMNRRKGDGDTKRDALPQ